MRLYVNKNIEYITYSIPIVTTFISVFIALNNGYFKELYVIIPQSFQGNNIIIIGFTLGLIPLTIVKMINFMYIRNFEKTVPKFLDIVIENIKGGQTFLNALEKASELYKYPIGSVIKDSITKFKLGFSFEESMNLAEKKFKIKQAKEFISIIKKSFFSGENAINILKNASEYYWLLENYRATREAQLKIYIPVIVLSFIIFLFLSGITISQLFKPLIQAQPSLEEAAKKQVSSSLQVFIFKINLEAIISSLYWMGFFQALFSGLILSKIIYNRIGRGLIYSLIFLFMLILFYNIYPF